MTFQSLRKESKLEIFMALREPAFILPTLSFPFMFYAFFGLMFANENISPSYYMVTYAVFGIMGASLFGFGANIAMDRDKGWLAIKQVSPMHPLQLILAKLCSAMTFASIIIAGLFLMAIIFGNVQLRISQWITLLIILLTGTLPFCAMGLAIGFWVKGSAAVAIVNLVYLPMAFLSGLWIPIHVLPNWLQGLAQVLPPFHLSQFGLNVISHGLGQSQIWHLLALFMCTVLFLMIATFGYKRSISE